MKIVIVLALICVALQVEARAFRLKRDADLPMIDTCIEQLHLDRLEIYAISSRYYGPEDNESYISFMACYWQKKGYLLEDGSINYDALKQKMVDMFEDKFSPEHSNRFANTISSSCNHIQGTSAGQNAIKMENCLLRELRNLELDAPTKSPLS